MIIASGHCSKEFFPYKNQEVYKGKIIPGGRYREPSVFAGKTVLCLGRSYTSTDIAIEASTTALKVIQLCRTNSITSHKFINGVNFDLLQYSINNLAIKKNPLMPTPEERNCFNRELIKTYGNPGEILNE